LRPRNPVPFVALLGAQALIAVGWVAAPPSSAARAG
jgi:hypothetical protein